MYIPSDFKNAFALTPEEIQKEQVTFTRLQMILASADKISYCSRSHNNYGEFRFITAWIGNTQISFYGHGTHEYRGIEYGEHFVVYEYTDFGYHSSKTTKLNYGEVVNELLAEHREYSTDSRVASEYKSQLFNMVANLTDDDAAYAELQDIGEI